jgi:hypothetical protein
MHTTKVPRMKHFLRNLPLVYRYADSSRRNTAFQYLKITNRALLQRVFEDARKYGSNIIFFTLQEERHEKSHLKCGEMNWSKVRVF